MPIPPVSHTPVTPQASATNQAPIIPQTTTSQASTTPLASFTPEAPITLLREHPDSLTDAAAWFSSKWGIPIEAYQESMEACLANHRNPADPMNHRNHMNYINPIDDRNPINTRIPTSDTTQKNDVLCPAVPQWYFLQDTQGAIVAGCGVIENDFHDRKDLAPNLCALYVEEAYRGQGIAGRLLEFACRDMAQFGLSELYLVTDHTSFYERYGWSFHTMVKGDDGCKARLYHRCLSEFFPPTAPSDPLSILSTPSVPLHSQSVPRVLVFGSLNLDHVYQVDHIVAPGETLASREFQTFCGGKGLNQAIAFAKAGADTYLAGKIGTDGAALQETCRSYGVSTEFLISSDLPSGHAIIQVDRQGQNSILLFGGANQAQSRTEIDQILEHFEAGDRLVLQNEINELPYLIEAASSRGMEIILNPSPYRPELMECGLKHLSWLILNEVEGFQMTGETEPDAILAKLRQLCPKAGIVLTLGEDGSVCSFQGRLYRQACIPAKAVDTTAAGDTFTGYFFTKLLPSKPVKSQIEQPADEQADSLSDWQTARQSNPATNHQAGDPANSRTLIETALYHAAKAASLTVSRNGAAASIPTRQELFL